MCCDHNESIALSPIIVTFAMTNKYCGIYHSAYTLLNFILFLLENNRISFSKDNRRMSKPNF